MVTLFFFPITAYYLYLYGVFSVGTAIGDISLWDVSSREKLASKSFQVWDIGASSMVLKVCSFLTNLSFGKIVILSSECLNSILILVKFRHP